MTDEIKQTRDESTDERSSLSPMSMCPMGETCKGMMGKPFSSFLMFVPGIVFIAVGVLVIVEPKLLIWLIAAGLILVGLAMLGGAFFMRSMGAKLMRTHH